MMKKTTYLRMTDGLRNRPRLLGVLKVLNKILPLAVVGIYGCTLLWMLVTKNSLLISAVLIPAGSFVGLTLVRAKINAPRPYEVFDCEPAIPKHKEGKSFPSRHVFSAFVIGTTLSFILPVAGICVLVCGVVLAVIRVVTGVHFVKDVICGGAIGIVCGMVMILM